MVPINFHGVQFESEAALRKCLLATLKRLTKMNNTARFNRSANSPEAQQLKDVQSDVYKTIRQVRKFKKHELGVPHIANNIYELICRNEHLLLSLQK